MGNPFNYRIHRHRNYHETVPTIQLDKSSTEKKRESRLIKANEPIRAIAFVSKPIDTSTTLILQE